MPKKNINGKIYVKNDTLRYYRGTGNESSLAPINNNKFQMLDAGVDLKTKFEYIKKKQIMTVTVNDVDPDVFESLLKLINVINTYEVLSNSLRSIRMLMKYQLEF